MNSASRGYVNITPSTGGPVESGGQLRTDILLGVGWWVGVALLIVILGLAITAVVKRTWRANTASKRKTPRWVGNGLVIASVALAVDMAAYFLLAWTYPV